MTLHNDQEEYKSNKGKYFMHSRDIEWHKCMAEGDNILTTRGYRVFEKAKAIAFGMIIGATIFAVWATYFEMVFRKGLTK